MTVPSTRPTNQDRIRAALWFAERGFGIFPVWSTRDGGVCRCPAGRDCTSPGKHPLTNDGFKAATDDAQRITTFLSAASEPNYGMTCPDGVFALDVDGDGIEQLADLEAKYGVLPATLRTQTANGQHIFLRWPDEHPRPLKQLFGYVTRWGSGSHAGYVIGPRSVHPSGVEYAPAEDSFDIATVPEAWASAGVTPERPNVTVNSGPALETVTAGGRHDFLARVVELGEHGVELPREDSDLIRPVQLESGQRVVRLADLDGVARKREARCDDRALQDPEQDEQQDQAGCDR